ncbi:MAG: Nitrilase/cyanide hydratase and apolipoprotein N-acyltransferase [Sporomusa sp.]|nr:Nitrilase/cyanide hydratase and apolipoprotein N-acyltransferase [Sporomusa sp.]
MPALQTVTSYFPRPLFIAASLSAVLFFYSTGFNDNWLLTWLAPLPVCLYALQVHAGKAALAAFPAYVLGAMNQFGYLPPLLFAGTTVLNAVIFTASVLLFRTLVQEKHQTFAPFAFAAFWTSYEFVRSLFSSFGTFESLAYTQVFNLPVIQLASLTGIWGITFLLMLIPASLAVLWHCRNQSSYYVTGLLTGGLLLAVLLFGIYRLYLPGDGPVLKVGLAAIPATREELRSENIESITNTLRNYSHSTNALAAAGAQVVLLPEKIAFLTPAAREAGLSVLIQTAGKNKVTLIAGLSLQEDHLYNAALVFAPDGSLLHSYHKQHLLPAYENRYTPGKDLALLDTGIDNRAGIAICKDLDFVQPSREYSRQEAGILFVPALDFHDDGWLHARIAVMRGVEGNYAVARAAQWGLLTVSDSRGRLLGVTVTGTAAGEASLLREVPLGGGQSLYSQTGDWLAWLCLLITTLTIFQLCQKRTNKKLRYEEQ